ncbi:hypothetical protein FNW52_03710 [Flavobacterium sp. ZT3R18]|uniref:hypothetical protein n=1 Tax=Flavobacterium sp. ZT3R18 TaxID=2594429 RepID=UPI001179C70A|nr:hypothetical protein [Flavobacterium sp. ZT3R18]TRX38018.1 hypothetical protein FNW52_03710 [Flavobacterium sp. ZT3R18]
MATNQLNSFVLKLTFLFILFSISMHQAFAQAQQDIVGFYQLRGGSHYLKADSTFVIIGYATLITGKWLIKEGGEVIFTPDHPDKSFYIYGRHDKNLKNESKFMLSNGLGEEETFIKMGTLDGKTPQLKRIFQKGNHCFKYPEVYSTKQKTDTISVSSIPYGYQEEKLTPTIYTFYNTNHYNDFVIIHYKQDYKYEPFSYLFKDNILYYGDHGGKKEDLKEHLKESNFSAISQTIFNPEEILLTPLYKNYVIEDKELFNEQYSFIESKNSFIDKFNYTENEEKSPDYEYNNTSILNQYKRIDSLIKFDKKFNIEEDAIFIYNCNK